MSVERLTSGKECRDRDADHTLGGLGPARFLAPCRPQPRAQAWSWDPASTPYAENAGTEGEDFPRDRDWGMERTPPFRAWKTIDS